MRPDVSVVPSRASGARFRATVARASRHVAGATRALPRATLEAGVLHRGVPRGERIAGVRGEA
jgi:hypothetical protein